MGSISSLGWTTAGQRFARGGYSAALVNSFTSCFVGQGAPCHLMALSHNSLRACHEVTVRITLKGNYGDCFRSAYLRLPARTELLTVCDWARPYPRIPGQRPGFHSMYTTAFAQFIRFSRNSGEAGVSVVAVAAPAGVSSAVDPQGPRHTAKMHHLARFQRVAVDLEGQWSRRSQHEFRQVVPDRGPEHSRRPNRSGGLWIDASGHSHR